MYRLNEPLYVTQLADRNPNVSNCQASSLQMPAPLSTQPQHWLIHMVNSNGGGLEKLNGKERKAGGGGEAGCGGEAGVEGGSRGQRCKGVKLHLM